MSKILEIITLVYWIIVSFSVIVIGIAAVPYVSIYLYYQSGDVSYIWLCVGYIFLAYPSMVGEALECLHCSEEEK